MRLLARGPPCTMVTLRPASRIGPVGDGLVVAAVLALREPVGAEGHLGKRLRARALRQASCGTPALRRRASPTLTFRKVNGHFEHSFCAVPVWQGLLSAIDSDSPKSDQHLHCLWHEGGAGHLSMVRESRLLDALSADLDQDPDRPRSQGWRARGTAPPTRAPIGGGDATLGSEQIVSCPSLPVRARPSTVTAKMIPRDD